MKLKDTELPMLYEKPTITEDRVEFKKLEKDEKISNIFDAIFKGILLNEKKIKYTSKLVSYLLEIDEEDFQKTFILPKMN